jgi:hypothetical protein
MRWEWGCGNGDGTGSGNGTSLHEGQAHLRQQGRPRGIGPRDLVGLHLELREALVLLLAVDLGLAYLTHLPSIT